MEMIYLDHAATTPIDTAVLSAMHKTDTEFYANPSSIHTAGQKSKVLLEDARRVIAGSIGAKPSEIIFTSGGTESNNMALIGAARSNRGRGNHIITSKIEHPAILETCNYLSKDKFQISYLDVDNNGEIDLAQLEGLIKKETILISLMMVNNETGNILPIKEVGNMLKSKSVIFHCDAVQAYDKLDIDVNEINVDLMTLSAHKIYGPKGVGALYIRRQTQMENILYGGAQESGRRPGTENLVAITGFAEAVKQISIQKKKRTDILRLRNLFEKKLKIAIPEILINCEKTARVPSHSNIYFPFISGDSLLINLDMAGIAVSAGSACSSGSPRPSHVLSAMGLDPQQVKNSIRFSLGRSTTNEEIFKTINTLKAIYNQITNK